MKTAATVLVSLSADQLGALNNALRREMQAAERMRGDPNWGAVDEYIGHLDTALRAVTRAFERMPK
ncbi:MAG: hypothetical protein J0H60_18705 [Rhizobiales bacterium]|nr:hypothetical protein [Hyphomicrobiales bacterium]